MRLPIFQIDAFTGRVFAGNPAAVVLMNEPLPDEIQQAIGTENNLSETAFVWRPDGETAPDTFGLRWFSPTQEIDLCGHATLAAAYVLFREGRVGGSEVTFRTMSGRLGVRREGDRLSLDFPSRPPEPVADDALLGAVTEALGARPTEIGKARDHLVVFATEAEVAGLSPRFDLLAAIDAFAFCVTAPGTDCDFVARFFAPGVGIDEDPVTGSAYCTLAPYWAGRLGKQEFFARQISARGGELWCADRGERVVIEGQAVEFMRGEIDV